MYGDYRSLYLAWLYACSRYQEWEEFDMELPEPPLSRCLKPFNGALNSWIKLLDIDQDLLSAVSQNQPGLSEEPFSDIPTLIP